jgi:hypothetical protein
VGEPHHAAAQQWDADAANAAMQTLLAGMPSDPLPHHVGTGHFDGSDGGAGPAGAGAGAAGRRARGGGAGLLALLRTDAPAVLLWFGRVIGEVVAWTQQARLLSAVLFAYAAAAGLLEQRQQQQQEQQQQQWQPFRPAFSWPAPPPAIVLCFSQLAVVAAATLLFGRAAARRLAERDGAGGSAGGERVPARARQLDLLSFLPGAREALSGLQGYQALAAAVSEDLAVYLLTCGLLSLAAAKT